MKPESPFHLQHLSFDRLCEEFPPDVDFAAGDRELTMDGYKYDATFANGLRVVLVIPMFEEGQEAQCSLRSYRPGQVDCTLVGAQDPRSPLRRISFGEALDKMVAVGRMASDPENPLDRLVAQQCRRI